MKKLLPLLILVFAVQISAQQRNTGSKSRIPPPATAKSVTDKIKQFLEKENGYRKFSENVWSVPFKGKSLTNFDVIISKDPDSDLVIMMVILAEKKDLRLSQDLLYEILKFNDIADYVKAGIGEEDGDLFLRAEIRGRLMDLQEFQSVLEQIAAASDQLHKRVSSSLVSNP